ncbi:MAG: DUF222 domain-containing protein [Actinomycetes bacterium]
MGSAQAYLPSDGMASLRAALDAAASAIRSDHPGDGRTMDQLRVDALVQMAQDSLRTGRLGGDGTGQRLATAHGQRPLIQVTVPFSTLLGLDDQPGELAGYGPIPASVTRRIAADGTWRRLLTDLATGALLDYGKTRYQPPPDLIDHVIARDRRCRFPGCGQPAYRCQIDHTVPSPDGPTADTNLGPLCLPHHVAKTHAGGGYSRPDPVSSSGFRRSARSTGWNPKRWDRSSRRCTLLRSGQETTVNRVREIRRPSARRRALRPASGGSATCARRASAVAQRKPLGPRYPGGRRT